MQVSPDFLRKSDGGTIPRMRHDEPEPILPTPERVREACKSFDEDEDAAVTEHALADLFSQYPTNGNHAHVLLKVVALNRLYSTNIFRIYDVARHVFTHGEEIDSALADGSPGAVDKLAFVITATRKKRTYYSFASKYCSWHNELAYPIWDSRVEKYLRLLRKSPFAAFLGHEPDSWMEYAGFLETMTKFRAFYRLEAFSFKEIDKFLRLNGGMARPAMDG